MSPRDPAYRVPKPWALELHQLCDKFNSLPRAGGIMDQELFELYMMQAASNIVVIYDMTQFDISDNDLRGLYDLAIEYAQRLQRILFP